MSQSHHVDLDEIAIPTGLGANLTSAEESYLLGPNSPFSKIYSMTLAALTQTAVDYDLQLSFLLKGGRGVGKFTVASWVAEHLGLHLFEVSFLLFNIASVF